MFRRTVTQSWKSSPISQIKKLSQNIPNLLPRHPKWFNRALRDHEKKSKQLQAQRTTTKRRPISQIQKLRQKIPNLLLHHPKWLGLHQAVRIHENKSKQPQAE